MEPQYETVELEGDFGFKAWRFTCPSLEQDHGWHYHPEYELTYVVKSEGIRFVGDSIHHFEPGDLVLLGPNLPHCWQNDHVESDDPETCDLIVAQFSRQSFGEYFLSLAEIRKINQLLERSDRGLHVYGKTALEVQKKFTGLVQQKHAMRLLTLLECLHLISISEETTALASDTFSMEKDEFHGKRVSKVVRYVRDHLDEDIKQPEIADMVGLTPQGFSRFFKAATGQTFVSFVNVVRITEACRILVNSDRDITDIAFSCGYSNLSNFNRRFMEFKQLTPRDYRAMHKKLESGKIEATR